MIFAKIGALIYILWGMLHVFAAYKVYALAQTVEQGMIQGRLYQDAWNLLFFAVFGIVIAIMYNWKNSKNGYVYNLIVVSVGDIGFIITILVPGHLPLLPGSIGPILWLLALAFTTVALLKYKTT